MTPTHRERLEKILTKYDYEVNNLPGNAEEKAIDSIIDLFKEIIPGKIEVFNFNTVDRDVGWNKCVTYLLEAIGKLSNE